MRATVTRRRVLIGATGAISAIALAACGEAAPQVVTKEVVVEKTVIKEVPVETVVTKTEIKEVPVDRVVTQEKVVTKEIQVEVEKVVTKIVPKVIEVEKVVQVEKVVEKIVEVAPMAPPVKFVFHTDHTSGPRGAAMGWALDNFAREFPNIDVKFVLSPDANQEMIAIMIAAGTQPEAVLMPGWFAAQFLAQGAFTVIDDVLQKHDGFDPTEWYWCPDESTVNLVNERPFPHRDGLRGPFHGMPYQGNLNVLSGNLALMESAGVEFPTPGNWGIQTEMPDALRRITDPETDTYGLWDSGTLVSSNAISWGWALSDEENLMYYNKDATRWTVFDSGAHVGLQMLRDFVLEEGLVPSRPRYREIRGDAGEPFSNGKIGFFHWGGGVGGPINRIKDRFPWALIPLPEGPRGPQPQKFSDEPHLITQMAGLRGNTESVVEWLLYLAGPKVQSRVAIDRGSVTWRKDVASSPEYAAGPPENHVQQLHYLESDNPAYQQRMHPAWQEMVEQSGYASNSKVMLGEVSVEQGIEEMLGILDRYMEENHDRFLELKSWAASQPNPVTP